MYNDISKQWLVDCNPFASSHCGLWSFCFKSLWIVILLLQVIVDCDSYCLSTIIIRIFTSISSNESSPFTDDFITIHNDLMQKDYNPQWLEAKGLQSTMTWSKRITFHNDLTKMITIHNDLKQKDCNLIIKSIKIRSKYHQVL
jgi:hypothetical protein